MGERGLTCNGGKESLPIREIQKRERGRGREDSALLVLSVSVPDSISMHGVMRASFGSCFWLKQALLSLRIIHSLSHTKPLSPIHHSSTFQREKNIKINLNNVTTIKGNAGKLDT